jgi:NADPH2:quinone reductase
LDYVELAVPEVCGIVSGVGTGVTRLAVGDRVATSDAVGAYAEFAVAPATW